VNAPVEPDPIDPPVRLASINLGGERRWTREDMARDLGVDVAVARRLWRAMGFADVGDARAFADSDRDAAKVQLDLVDEGVIDLDTAIEVVRSLGRTTARIAEWQAELASRLMVSRGVVASDRTPNPQERAQIRAYAERLLPVVEQALTHAWRRQLVAALERIDVGAGLGAAAESASVSVVFADVVGFTRLSRRLEPAELAAFVDNFETISVDVVASAGARLVKTLGDEILFVADTPEQAVQAALALLAAHDDLHIVRFGAGGQEATGAEQVELRLGIATGPVVSRLGDVFGTTVNLASRLTTLAPPGGLMVDSVTASAVGALYEVIEQEPRMVRGMGTVTPYSLLPRVVRPT
jgi:adenylate cyclase